MKKNHWMSELRAKIDKDLGTLKEALRRLEQKKLKRDLDVGIFNCPLVPDTLESKKDRVWKALRSVC